LYIPDLSLALILRNYSFLILMTSATALADYAHRLPFVASLVAGRDFCAWRVRAKRQKGEGKC
jgi:hypothetical protein